MAGKPGVFGVVVGLGVTFISVRSGITTQKLFQLLCTCNVETHYTVQTTNQRKFKLGDKNTHKNSTILHKVVWL